MRCLIFTTMLREKGKRHIEIQETAGTGKEYECSFSDLIEYTPTDRLFFTAEFTETGKRYTEKNLEAEAIGYAFITF